jgi:mutator protein MutT
MAAQDVTAIVVAAAVVERDDSFLLARRPDGTPLEGCWEFPGGKCEAGETLESCLRREMREELGVEIAIGGERLAVRREEGGRALTIHFFDVGLAGEPEPRLGQEIRWVPRAELPSLACPEPDRELIVRLVRGGSEAG